MICPSCGKSIVAPEDVPDQVCDSCKGVGPRQRILDVLLGNTWNATKGVNYQGAKSYEWAEAKADAILKVI